MAEKYEVLRKPKTLAEIVASVTKAGTPTYGGDENVDWTAVGRGYTPTTTSGTASTVPTYTPPPTQPPPPVVPKTTTAKPAGTIGSASVPSSVAAPQPAGTVPPPTVTPTQTGGTMPTSNPYSSVDRSNYTSYAQTIAKLQNDPKILALKQKIASMKAGGADQQAAIEKAYGSLPQQVMDFLMGQKQRITDTYNQRGLYGSGMEIGQLSQAEQAAQTSIATANQNKADEIAKLLRDMGLFEQQANEQLAQVQGSSGDIISSIVQELNMKADAEDQRRREAAQAFAVDQQRYLDQLKQQDWTNNFNQQQFAADQAWNQKNYNLDLQRLNEQVAEQQAQAAYDAMTPAQQAADDLMQGDLASAVKQWMNPSYQAAAMEDGINIMDIWQELQKKYNLPDTSFDGSNGNYMTPAEVLKRIMANQGNSPWIGRP